MLSQDDRVLLYDFGGYIIILVFCLLLFQSLYLLLLLWASHTRQPFVFALPERDQSHNV